MKEKLTPIEEMRLTTNRLASLTPHMFEPGMGKIIRAVLPFEKQLYLDALSRMRVEVETVRIKRK